MSLLGNMGTRSEESTNALIVDALTVPVLLHDILLKAHSEGFEWRIQRGQILFILTDALNIHMAFVCIGTLFHSHTHTQTLH